MLKVESNAILVVNQNQTFRQEIAALSVSPKTQRQRDAILSTSRCVKLLPASDFSFVDTRITAIGIAKSYCWVSQPTEFGSTGKIGEHRMRVTYRSVLLNKIRPKDHMMF